MMFDTSPLPNNANNQAPVLADLLSGLAVFNFTKIYEEKFLSDFAYEGEEADEETMLAYWRDGILIVIESFHETGVNRATMYYNWVSKNGNSFRHIESGRCVEAPTGESILSGHHNINYGKFLNVLKTLEKEGTFLAEWEDSPSVWLVNYVEAKNSSDYDLTMAKKFATFPAEVLVATKLT